ncbi:hypothetical protein [Streptomyces niveus]|uniref:hypothetical protein n=1 Tax=Streptomyces niveus TaxID=193462 RepID=UPI0036D3BBF0
MSTEAEPQTFPADWDFTRVIKGQIVEPELAAEEVDDIAPGMVETVPARTPVLRQTASAAMVVASVTGKAAGLTARAVFPPIKWFAVGAAATSVLGWRYVRAHDHQEVLGGMSSGTDWAKVERTRKSRWKILGWSAAAVAALDLAGWWALVKYGELAALDWSWAVIPGIEAAAAAALVTAYGRYRLQNPGIGPGQVLADEDQDDGEEPYPLALCVSSEQVEDCVGRALAWENIGTRHVNVLGRHAWGWEVDVTLKGSKVAKVNEKADDLDSHFDVKRGGTLIDPDPQRSAHLALRLVTANPFANMPRPQVHAPNSLDISDPHNFGLCMDGSPLDLILEGLRILAIGVSGAAKTTGVLRDLAEVITACHNAIALDLDPVKDGLREFEGVMAAPPIRGNKACEKWLEYLVKMAKGRNAVRNRLNMGDTWIATREHPAIFPFVDEFIYLSDKAKKLFIELLRLAKQSGIFPVAAGQDATSDSMGDAIADSFTLRIMLAARHADIPLVLGSGAIAAGYRPDRLVPAQNKDVKNDAGQSYIKGPGLDRPLLYGWNEHSRDGIKRAVADRVAAGRPWFDRDTLASAGLLHLADGGSERVLGAAQVVADAVAAMANEGVDRMKTEKLVEALADCDPDAYGDLSADDLKVLLKEAGAGSPVQLGRLDGEQNPRGYKLESLTVLS